MKIKLEDVIANIEQGVRYLSKEIKPGVNYTILIGPTGAGKSTLSNVLTGYKIIKTKVEGKPAFIVEGESKFKIGHSNKSETTHPNIQGAYIDCPGFGDTDPNKELQNAVYIKRAFACSKEKVLIVTDYASIFSGKAQAFIKLLKDINGSTGGKFLNLSKQFGLCISKVSSDDYDEEITNNPLKISGIIQQELSGSSYQEGANLIKALEDRIFCFMKNDQSFSVEAKLKAVMGKMIFGDSIPISPVISLEGQKSIKEMIGEIFLKIIELDKTAASKYIRDAQDDLKTANNSSYNSIKHKLKNHTENNVKIIKQEISKIENSEGMGDLIIKLNESGQTLSNLLSLSTHRLDSIKYIIDIYPNPNELSQNYKLQITRAIRPIGNWEEKACKLSYDLDLMDKDWDSLKPLTTTSEVTQGLIVAGGVVAIGGLAIATGGAAIAAIAAIETAAAATAAVSGIGLAGVAAIVGTGLGVEAAAKRCNAYEASHPEVIPHANELKKLYKKIPDACAKLWASSHDPEKSEYLPDLKIELTGNHNDDFSSPYNDIIL